MPTFSILVITYNRHDLLEECLKSIEDQSFKDFEVYVLDRGSIPSAKNIVEKFDNRFKYIQSSQEVHIVDGANEIINKLQGEIFFHLADDDVICKNTLQEVYNALKNNQECDVAQVGLIGYDYLLDKNNINWEHFSRHSKYNFNNKEPHITIIEGKTSCQLEWQCSNVLINTRIKINQPFTRLHPSCLFFRLHKLKEVCNYKKVFL